MSRLTAVINRDVTHKHSASTPVTAAQRCVSCVQLLLVVGRTGLYIVEVRNGRKKLRNEEFDDLCVRKNDEVTEGEMDGSVTDRE